MAEKKRKERVKKTTARVLGRSSIVKDSEEEEEEEDAAPAPKAYGRCHKIRGCSI